MPKWGSRDKPWPISATDLDNWSWFQGPGMNPPHESIEPMTDEDFLRRLNRTDDVGPPLIVGQCFHNAIEQAMAQARVDRQPITLDAFTGTHEGHRINFATSGKIRGTEYRCAAALQHYTIAEQDMELVFDTPSGWVHLRMKLDGLRGTVVRDLKTTKSFKSERYQDSWQWRSYLEAAGPKYTRFDYLVFEVSYGKPLETALAAGRPADVLIRGFHPMSCYRYPTMRRDLQGVAGELASYLDTIGWEPGEKRQMNIF